ncbi:MAG: hypothetical protein RMM08_01095 [Armatimonadota bacterium]|nr:hypothetical protein [Armatimonadota bacterium]
MRVLLEGCAPSRPTQSDGSAGASPSSPFVILAERRISFAAISRGTQRDKEGLIESLHHSLKM